MEMEDMMKKIVLCIIALSFILTGCSTSSYKRDTGAGKVEKITLAQMEEKIANKEDFAIMLTQSMCSYCQAFEEILTPYIANHAVTMYDVVLDKEATTPQENLVVIKKTFANFSSTPGIYYVEKGKMKSQLLPQNGTITEQNLDTWVQENQIDKK